MPTAVRLALFRAILIPCAHLSGVRCEYNHHRSTIWTKGYQMLDTLDLINLIITAEQCGFLVCEVAL